MLNANRVTAILLATCALALTASPRDAGAEEAEAIAPMGATTFTALQAFLQSPNAEPLFCYAPALRHVRDMHGNEAELAALGSLARHLPDSIVNRRWDSIPIGPLVQELHTSYVAAQRDALREVQRRARRALLAAAANPADFERLRANNWRALNRLRTLRIYGRPVEDDVEIFIAAAARVQSQQEAAELTQRLLNGPDSDMAPAEAGTDITDLTSPTRRLSHLLPTKRRTEWQTDLNKSATVQRIDVLHLITAIRALDAEKAYPFLRKHANNLSGDDLIELAPLLGVDNIRALAAQILSIDMQGVALVLPQLAPMFGVDRIFSLIDEMIILSTDQANGSMQIHWSIDLYDNDTALAIVIIRLLDIVKALLPPGGVIQTSLLRHIIVLMRTVERNDPNARNIPEFQQTLRRLMASPYGAQFQRLYSDDSRALPP